MFSRQNVWRASRSVEVPANASRFLRSPEDAQPQDVSTVQLAWHDDDPYLFNAAFDPSLIAHDEAYCTSVVDIHQVVQVPTADYFCERILPRAGEAPRVVDIGCGQGEFVEVLRAQGIDAVGFDPVLRSTTGYLHDRYWSAEDAGAEVFVMRCVLPHISDPWVFMQQVGESHPDALVLVEFQRLEWILEQSIWYQVSHDHVNVFSASDFESRFTVEDQGTFSDGEWAWVVIRAGSFVTGPPRGCAFAPAAERLLDDREAAIGAAVDLNRPIAIWGAAGKGIVLAHALLAAGAEVTAAIDADAKRHGLFMEVSGVPIVSPDRAEDCLTEETLILVCNPNHLPSIRDRVGDVWELALPRDLAR